MVKIEFFDPSGSISPTHAHARRLDTLDGKKIGFVTIAEWQAFRTFPLLAATLKADFPNAELLPLDTFPHGIAAVAKEETAKIIAASGVDAVVIGNAA